MFNPSKVSILINHPEPLGRHGLTVLLQDYMASHGVAGDIMQTRNLSQIQEHTGTADFYFLHEKCIGQKNAIHFVRDLRKESKRAKVCLTIAHRKIFRDEEILTAGVNALICTSCTVDDVSQAIDALYHGSVYFSPKIAELMSQHYTVADKLRDRFQLTKRELEIIQLVGKGQSSKEIARVCGISPRTVETHRQNILQKCNLKNSMMVARLISEYAA